MTTQNNPQPASGDGEREKLTKNMVEHMFVTAFQDGFGCATNPKYKNRTVEHTERLWSAVQQAVMQAKIDEINILLSKVPMPKLSYEQVENRLTQLRQQQNNK